MNKSNSLSPEQLYFIPLGGSEQFGVNLNVYEYDGKLLVVDCGIGFANERYPGVDILLPDPSYLTQRKEDIAGIIITHAHEDHIGALPYLWAQLQAPIYCSQFTSEVLKHKFSESKDCKGSSINIINSSDNIKLGPFELSFVDVSHSIPDTLSVAIKTDLGMVIHSGDWNLDDSLVIGEKTNEADFKKLSNDNDILAYIGDSTNSEFPKLKGSEKDVEKGLYKSFAECKGRIIVTLFASNIARIHSICAAARKHNRRVCVIGRSLHTMIGCAKQSGYLNDIEELITEDEAEYFPEDKILFIVTGSQGEARAQLSRIARGDHSKLKLGSGDTVIFSSKEIPGNEVAINHVKNNILASGASIIEDKNSKHLIHVSGHPYKEEVCLMYQWINPNLVIPVHGERVQLEAQAKLAKNCQIQHVLVPNNGSVIKIAPGQPEIIDHVDTGLLAVGSKRILDSDHASILQRRKLQYTGAMHVSVVLDKVGRLIAQPKLSTIGIIDSEDPEELMFETDLADEVEDIMRDISKDDLKNDHIVQEELRIALRRIVLHETGIKVKTTVHVVRV
jgi:ribonuclease J